MPVPRRLANGVSTWALSLVSAGGCATARTACGSSAPQRAPRRPAARRPLRGRDAPPQGACSAAAAASRGCRCRRSTRASRAPSGRSPTRCAWRAPCSRRHRRARRRPSAGAPVTLRGAPPRLGAADRPRHAPRVDRGCGAAAAGRPSTSSSSSPSTGSATGPSGCTRRSTRTAATTSSSRRRPRSAVLIGTRRLRFAGGALLAMALAGVFADLVLEIIQLGVDRPRPEEALGAEVAAQPRPPLEPHPVVPLRAPDRDHRARGRRLRHGAASCGSPRSCTSRRSRSPGSRSARTSRSTSSSARSSVGRSASSRSP